VELCTLVHPDMLRIHGESLNLKTLPCSTTPFSVIQVNSSKIPVGCAIATWSSPDGGVRYSSSEVSGDDWLERGGVGGEGVGDG
jgi:hypothetical protein